MKRTTATEAINKFGKHFSLSDNEPGREPARTEVRTGYFLLGESHGQKSEKSISANARRQAVFASRMRESGKKRVAFWVTPEEETRLRKFLNGDREPEIIDLPELTGSEKQIDWAIDIRLKRLRELSDFLDPKNSWASLWNNHFSGISIKQGRTISERDARTRRGEIVNAT